MDITWSNEMPESQHECSTAPEVVEGTLSQVIVHIVGIFYADHVRPSSLEESVILLVEELSTIPASTPERI